MTSRGVIWIGVMWNKMSIIEQISEIEVKYEYSQRFNTNRVRHVNFPTEARITLTLKDGYFMEFSSFLVEPLPLNITPQSLLNIELLEREYQDKDRNVICRFDIGKSEFKICSTGFNMENILYDGAVELLSQNKPMEQIAKELQEDGGRLDTSNLPG